MSSRAGLAAGLGAFMCWGLFPLYWKPLRHIPAFELLAHRVVWSLVWVGVLCCFQKRWAEFAAVMRSRRLMGLLVLTSFLIGINWVVFIWAVNAGFIVESSLGYFICPLVNVLLGVFVLGESLRKLQVIALMSAALGVFYLTFSYGQLPWIALSLASSFAVYGLIRKKIPVTSITGLGLETVILFPAAFLMLVFLEIDGQGALGHTDYQSTILLVLSGVVTALPLILFTEAARRLPLSTIGVLQYLGPSLQLGIGVLVFGEPFTSAHKVAFPLIWLGLALYTVDGIRRVRDLG